MKALISLVLILAFVFPCFDEAVRAQDKYPSRAIELVVPFASGGGTSDLAGRIYGDALSKLLKVPVNIINKPGGTGIQGTDYVIRSNKDGYTLLAATDTPLIVMPVISKEVTYDPLKDVIPIGHFSAVPSIFAVRSDSPFKTLAELVEFARKNPGKLKNSMAGFGTEAFFNLQLLCTKQGIKITSIPFKGGAESMVAVLGGHTDLVTSSVGSLSSQLKAGKIRGLAISSPKRHPDFPDIPTTAELGYPDVNLSVWLAMFAPAGVPKQVVDVLVPAFEKACKDPEVIQRGTNAGLVVEYLGPEEIRKLMVSGIEVIKKLAPEAGLTK
jgi:tripartite-type tricarboxylate transporter receptor subunit TctC